MKENKKEKTARNDFRSLFQLMCMLLFHNNIRCYTQAEKCFCMANILLNKGEKQMNKFERISKEQFKKDFDTSETVGGKDIWFGKIQYEDIKLPVRATKYSAGFDFFSPIDISLAPGESFKIPTGIRVLLDEDKFLALVPRSGLGFKYRLQLDNTIGIIDADYSGSKNEGHIWVKMTNDGTRDFKIAKGEAFAQGIIMQYFVTVDDDATAVRDGGFGSTTK